MGKHRFHVFTGQYNSQRSDLKTFASYQTMVHRTTDPTAENYRYYGGRGIKVCKHWLGWNGFLKFRADMGPRPIGKTLDRIDNNKGYSKSNCRWSSRSEQASNRRRNRRNKTGYPGVTFQSSTGLYQSKVMLEKQMYYLGSFKRASTAAKARAEFIAWYHREFR